MVHELPAALGAAGSVCCAQGARLAEAWRSGQSEAGGGLPCGESGCHLSLEGWTSAAVTGRKLAEQRLDLAQCSKFIDNFLKCREFSFKRIWSGSGFFFEIGRPAHTAAPWKNGTG